MDRIERCGQEITIDVLPHRSTCASNVVIRLTCWYSQELIQYGNKRPQAERIVRNAASGHRPDR
jgi:hypothetical protein